MTQSIPADLPVKVQVQQTEQTTTIDVTVDEDDFKVLVTFRRYYKPRLDRMEPWLMSHASVLHLGVSARHQVWDRVITQTDIDNGAAPFWLGQVVEQVRPVDSSQPDYHLSLAWSQGYTAGVKDVDYELRRNNSVVVDPAPENPYARG